MIDFKPSQVVLGVPPLVATMGCAEAEFAAALIVRACHALGNAWQPIAWKQIREVVLSDFDAKREPFASLIQNPFFRPDVHDLVERGCARWTTSDDSGEGSVELTADGLEKLRRWVASAP